MPSPFKALKQNPHKKGSLSYDLFETKKDIRKAKRGEQGEASLEEMRLTKKRIKQEIKEAESEERSSAAREAMRNMRPRQLSPVHAKMQHSFS